MTPEQIHNLREAMAWARVNGWHRVSCNAWERPMGAYVLHVSWYSRDYRLSVSRRGDQPMRLFFYDRLRDVEQAIDLLVSLNYLPNRFHSAYAAGRASVLDGAREEWASENPDGLRMLTATRREAEYWVASGADSRAVHRYVTRWEAPDA